MGVLTASWVRAELRAAPKRVPKRRPRQVSCALDSYLQDQAGKFVVFLVKDSGAPALLTERRPPD